VSLDRVIADLYDSMCFEPGGSPDWERHAAIFAPAARLVRVNDDGVFEFTPATFRADLEAMIASGALPSFWEGEVRRETREFGELAHVLSVYETRGRRDGEPLGLAVKSMQLFRRDGRWWVSALLWRRETTALPIGDLRAF
jgi:hypothetical protein